jgi:YggT family protein
MLVAIELVQLLGYLFMLCLFVRAIFSWVEPYPRNRVHRLTYDVTEPVLAPVRRVIPPVGGLDISFLVVFIAVAFLIQLVGRV